MSEKLSTSLFTPYGYKFETAEANGAIRENYRITGVKGIVESPWKLSIVGWIDIRKSNAVTSLGNGSGYWGSASNKDARSAYHVWMQEGRLYPSVANASLHSFSVREK